jgi:hypothetical protein
MWTARATASCVVCLRPPCCVGGLWTVRTDTPGCRHDPDCAHVVHLRGDYSAHNSCLAYSTFSRNIRSRDIWRVTLSTLWMTVE